MKIEQVTVENYPMFDDLLYWREHGAEREAGQGTVTEDVRQELQNPDLYLFAAASDGRYVGWISLVYIPKVSKWRGHGHVYVDELWVAPQYRRQGVAAALTEKADELRSQFNAVGIRLYVNVENPGARRLYESCGFREDGQAHFMEKY